LNLARPSPSAPSLAIHAGRVFDGRSMLGPRRIEIVDGRVAAVLDAARSMETEATVELPAGATLAPGFIDLQVNGGGDALLNEDPSPQTIARIAAAHGRFGTTGLLPTLITVVVGIVVYGVFAFWAHGVLIGVKPMG